MRPIDADAIIQAVCTKFGIKDKKFLLQSEKAIVDVILNAPTIDAVEVVRCKECKHRPIKEDVDGENYGFNLIKPNDGDELCPCLVSDGWYSWMPEDNFFCGYGERKDEQ